MDTERNTYISHISVVIINIFLYTLVSKDMRQLKKIFKKKNLQVELKMVILIGYGLILTNKKQKEHLFKGITMSPECLNICLYTFTFNLTI